MAQPIVLTELAEGILTVTLNRPEAMNALSIDLAHELTRTWKRAAQDDVKAVVVTGAGRGFCAGADLRDARTGDVAREDLRVTYHPSTLAYVGLEKPVIAAVNGAAAGAGLSFVFGADARIGGPHAKLVPAFSSIGLVPDSGVGFLSGRVMGDAAAMMWLASGEKLDAEDALARGIFTAVVDDPVAEAREIAAALIATPGKSYALTKRMFWAQARPGLLANLDMEGELQALAVADPERAAARAKVVSAMGAGASSEGKNS